MQRQRSTEQFFIWPRLYLIKFLCAFVLKFELQLFKNQKKKKKKKKVVVSCFLCGIIIIIIVVVVVVMIQLYSQSQLNTCISRDESNRDIHTHTNKHFMIQIPFYKIALSLVKLFLNYTLCDINFRVDSFNISALEYHRLIINGRRNCSSRCICHI